MMNTSNTLNNTDVADYKFVIPTRYTNLKYVGQWGHNVVSVAFDTVRGEKISIKKIINPLRNEMYAKALFRELKLLKVVKHKNIISLLEVFIPNNSVENFHDVYMVTEPIICYMNKLNYDMNIHMISYLVYQVFCGVNYLHFSGIIHRNLQPGNIAVGMTGTIKILHLNMARLKASGTNISPYVQSHFYCAPDITLGMRHTEKMDIWAVGCIFAERVLRKVLFNAYHPADQIIQIFSILGSPSQQFLNQIHWKYLSRTITTPNFLGLSFNVLFPDYAFMYCHTNMSDVCCPANARDLLSKLLRIDPEERITVAEALQHPFLRSWYNHNDVQSRPAKKYNPLFDEKAYNMAEWRQLISREIMKGLK